MTAHDDFFQRKQAAAVLKHGILTRYPPVFATMTGSTSTGGRVVYLDGYAGPGRYEPEPGGAIGAPGSPLLAVQNASTVAKWSRDLHCVFIERDATYANNLRQVLSTEAPATLKYNVMQGDVEQRLDDALGIAGDSPLLAFLDPFGTALPYQQMVDRIMKRGVALKTEVLLNLNLNLEMVWRIGGFLSGDETDNERTSSGRSATLERVDNFFGGAWWRDAWQRSDLVSVLQTHPTCCRGSSDGCADLRALGVGRNLGDELPIDQGGQQRRPTHTNSSHLRFCSKVLVEGGGGPGCGPESRGSSPVTHPSG